MVKTSLLHISECSKLLLLPIRQQTQKQLTSCLKSFVKHIRTNLPMNKSSKSLETWNGLGQINLEAWARSLAACMFLCTQALLSTFPILSSFSIAWKENKSEQSSNLLTQAISSTQERVKRPTATTYAFTHEVVHLNLL